jgi:hypothetical protein
MTDFWTLSDRPICMENEVSDIELCLRAHVTSPKVETTSFDSVQLSRL